MSRVNGHVLREINHPPLTVLKTEEPAAKNLRQATQASPDVGKRFIKWKTSAEGRSDEEEKKDWLFDEVLITFFPPFLYGNGQGVPS